MKINYLFILGLFLACAAPQSESENDGNQDKVGGLPIPQPEWVKDAVIYEVNVRQFTAEGTLAAFKEHLPRLDDLGVDILWFMPIHPIGKKKRKGGLGSYYSIQDYTKVDPLMGSHSDFEAIIKEAHDRGMYVIMDWVANHTAFDHPWTESNPEWYDKDSLGQITHPEGTDWYDVASLDYNQSGLWEAMIDDLEYWVDSFDIDGYRCDVAHEVPDSFWVSVNHALVGKKPLFMLAESDHAPHRNDTIFHANYGWHLHHIMNEIAQGKADPTKIVEYLKENEERYTRGFHMHFTSNHDENSWKGSAIERFGEMNQAMNVFAFTFQGIPLIYSGQESNLDKRLAFFEKDTIDWKGYEATPFFQQLVRLKKTRPSLWNRQEVANTEILHADEKVFHYRRAYESDWTEVIINFSDKATSYTPAKRTGGRNYFTGGAATVGPDDPLRMAPFEYLVIVP